MAIQTKQISLTEKLESLYGRERFVIKPGLENTKALLKALGDPHDTFRSIHIAGTNGKGSTAAILASVLKAGGYRVGLYTSPHLFTFNERAQINGAAIEDNSLEALIDEVREVATQQNLKPTFFEFTTALTFLYFARERVDVAVIEAGMGGRFDATNVVTPLASIITNISLDHTAWLGKTKHAIAKRKAGIIKPTVPCITAEDDPVIRDYFREVCGQNTSELLHIDDHVQSSSISHDWRQQTLSLSGDFVGEVTLPLIGDHQQKNLRTALTAIARLKPEPFNISRRAITTGVATVTWLGRAQVVATNPHVIIDGAHNAGSLATLALVVAELPQRDVLVVALTEDKDPAVLHTLAQKFSHVLTTEGGYRAYPAQHLASELAKVHPSVQAHTNPERAFATAVAKASPQGAIVITGSLYMIPSALRHFGT